MKLIYCGLCKDVVALRSTLRTCECGASSGRYISSVHAAISGSHVVPLGFSNRTFKNALKLRPLDGLGQTFEAFVIPQICDTITELAGKVDDEI